MARIKVLVIDDSALIRKLLTEILESDPDLHVVGAASDPYVARDKIKKLNPDVLTLDVEMPRMDGITFLGNLMRLRPMPVVMISTMTEAGAETTIRALELGAVDFISKPRLDINEGMRQYAEEIIEKVKVAAGVSKELLERRHQLSDKERDGPPANDSPATATSSRDGYLRTTDRIIAIGASTGGTEAVKEILTALPPGVNSIVITQHIPGAFSTAFAKRLNDITHFDVTEARQGDQLRPGGVYIAPGDRHLVIKRSGARYHCHLDDGAPVNRHKPSIDVMFRSIAHCAGPNAMGIMLTGMGADGAQGMLEMRHQGAFNIVQDEKSSVVWGMPGAAVRMNAVDKVVSLTEIYREILDYCEL